MHGTARATGSDTPTLRELWRTRTMATVWRTPGDWYHPAVDAITEAIAAGGNAAPAAERLGTARALVGVGIEETMDDAACAYGAANREIPTAVLRAVSVGWVLGQDAQPALVTCVDPVSSLPTREYLAVRMQELYAGPSPDGRPVEQLFGLLLIDIALEGLNAPEKFARDAMAGTDLVHLLGRGLPMACLRRGLFAAVVDRDDRLGETIELVRCGLSEGPGNAGPGSEASTFAARALTRRPPRVWLEPLPRTHYLCTRLLDELSA